MSGNCNRDTEAWLLDVRMPKIGQSQLGMRSRLRFSRPNRPIRRNLELQPLRGPHPVTQVALFSGAVRTPNVLSDHDGDPSSSTHCTQERSQATFTLVELTGEQLCARNTGHAQRPLRRVSLVSIRSSWSVCLHANPPISQLLSYGARPADLLASLGLYHLSRTGHLAAAALHADMFGFIAASATSANAIPAR